MNTKFNKSDFILLGIFFLVSTLMQSIDYHSRNALTREYWVDFPIDVLTVLLLIFAFMNWLIPSFIIKQKKYAHFILFSLIIMIVLGVLDKTIGYWSGDNDWSRFPSPFNLVLEGISISAEQMGLPFGLLLTKKFYESQNQLLTIEKQQKENELKLLRSQLDPHFLFNNLNTLDALIDHNTEKAKEYINRLSLIYRYLIQTKDSEIMELSKEVSFAENYIFLIKTRFENDYDFTINTKSDLNNKFIPTGALQALLENVVKHNKVLEKKIIKTTILIENDWLTVINSKSNSGLNSESLGTGLHNLKVRYSLLVDKQVQVFNTNSEYKISIPIIKLSDEN